MAGPSTPAGGGQPKIMSSRLLTMKFMQRAAASSNGPISTTTHAPFRNTTDPPSAKRQKLTDLVSPIPSSPPLTTPHSTDLRIESAALTAEERSRSEARFRSARAGGETEWILNLPGAKRSTNGGLRANEGSGDHVQEELAEDEIWRDQTVGRRSYGGFKKKKTQMRAKSLQQLGEGDEELSEADVSDLESGVSQNSTKRTKQQDLNNESSEKKRWQAMDKMNLKRQDHISGFSPKRALDDRTSKVKKKPRHSFKS